MQTNPAQITSISEAGKVLAARRKTLTGGRNGGRDTKEKAALRTLTETVDYCLEELQKILKETGSAELRFQLISSILHNRNDAAKRELE